MLSGQIIEWNSDRGFGYVESEGHRIFLHVRDFAKKHKMPETGDRITFEMGQDKQGRPCAKKAIHPRDGGRLTSEAILFLCLLLIAPIFALVRFSRVISGGYLACYFVAISVATYAVYAWDKNRAPGKKQREPEFQMHLLEFLGGWPGAFVAQRYLRHKCTKLGYQILFWLIVGLYQFVAIDYLRDWKTSGQAKHLFEEGSHVK